MNITRMAATITHVVFTADAVSERLGPAAPATVGTTIAATSAPAAKAGRRRGPARSIRLIMGGFLLVRSALGALVSRLPSGSALAGRRSLDVCRKSGRRRFDNRSRWPGRRGLSREGCVPRLGGHERPPLLPIHAAPDGASDELQARRDAGRDPGHD